MAWKGMVKFLGWSASPQMSYEAIIGTFQILSRDFRRGNVIYQVSKRKKAVRDAHRTAERKEMKNPT
jgi:hypothetical protein